MDMLSHTNGLWAERPALHSHEAAALEDELGTVPFTERGEMPETVGKIVRFYEMAPAA